MDLCEARWWLPAVSLLAMIGAIPLGMALRRRHLDSMRLAFWTLLYLVVCYGSAAILVRLMCGGG